MASKTIASDGTSAFGDPGASIAFAGTEGSGRVQVRRYRGGPSHTSGIPSDATTAKYRFAVTSDESP